MKHSKRKLVREYCTIAPKDYAISNTHQPLSHSILKDYPLCGNEIKPSGLRTPLFLKAFLFIAMFLVVPSIAEAIYYNSSGNLGDWAFGATACTYDINNIMNCPASSTALLVNKTINLSTNTNSWCLEFYGMTMTSGNTVPNWLVHNKNLSTTPDATSYVFTRGKVGAGQDLYARDRLTNDIGIQTDFTSDENIKHGIRVCFLQNVSINITVDGVYVGNQPLTNVDNGTHLGLTHEASSNTSFEGVAIYNGTENTIVVPPDTTLPIINGSLNKSITTIYFGDVINATFNWTDETEGSYGNITWNLSTGKTFTNFSGLSETSGQISNATRISCYGGCVINVTGYITDSSGNVKQNSTVFTVSDNISPLANVSLNNTSPKINEVINISVNATDETGLSFCQFINNQTGSKVFINTSISGTSDRCFQAFTVSVGRGNVINFSVVVNDTSNNKKTNSTVITVASTIPTHTAPLLNSSDGLNKTNANLTGFNQSGSDADGGLIYNYIWYKNKVKNATRWINDANLVLYLPFDGNSTQDYSRNGNDFTAFNGANVTPEGKIGEGYRFNYSQYLNVSDQSELSFTGASPTFAFAFWVNYNGVSGGGTAGTGGGAISKAAGGGQWEYSIEASASSGGQLILQTWTSGGGSGPFTAFSAGNAPHSIDGWHYMVVSADGTNARGYVDGVLKWTVDKVAAQMSDTNEDFVIGVASSPRTSFFNGTIDEVSVFNRDLTASEISQMYWGSINGFANLNASQTKKNENWTIEMTPYDVVSSGTPLNSSTMTILNSNTNASLITNTTGLNYNTNITFNWTAGNDIDLDTVYHLVYWSEDGNNFYLYSNTTQTNSSSNATNDGTYIFMVNATDYFGSMMGGGIVWNFTLDTNTPVLTYNISNNLFTNKNQTLKITMEDTNPFNLTGRFYGISTFNETSSQTPSGRFINITLRLNVTKDGNYTIAVNGSDKHTAKSFPDLETSYINGTLSFVSTNNPNRRIDLEFGYKVGTGDVQKITSTQISTYNIQKLITNGVDRISFGLEAETPPIGQNIKFGFRFLGTSNTKLIAQNENALFHLYGKYWLDFKTYIVNVATGQKTLLQENYLNQNGYHVVYYNITFADYGLSVGDRFRIITESIGGLNFVDETRTIVYDFTAPTFVDATNRSAADNSSNILTNTDVNISIFGLDDLYLSTGNFSHNASGSWTNHSIAIAGNTTPYHYIIGSGNFTSGQMVGWKFYAYDLAGNELDPIYTFSPNSPPPSTATTTTSSSGGGGGTSIAKCQPYAVQFGTCYYYDSINQRCAQGCGQDNVCDAKTLVCQPTNSTIVAIESTNPIQGTISLWDKVKLWFKGLFGTEAPQLSIS